MPVLAAGRDNERSQISSQSSPLRPRTPSRHGRETLALKCFTCYMSGHSFISCTDLSLKIYEPGFLRYQLTYCNLQDGWQKAWLKKIYALSLIVYRPSSKVTSPTALLSQYRPESNSKLSPSVKNKPGVGPLLQSAHAVDTSCYGPRPTYYQVSPGPKSPWIPLFLV